MLGRQVLPAGAAHAPTEAALTWYHQTKSSEHICDGIAMHIKPVQFHCQRSAVMNSEVTYAVPGRQKLTQLQCFILLARFCQMGT